MESPANERHRTWESGEILRPYQGVVGRRVDSEFLTLIRYELKRGANYPLHTHEREQFIQGLAGVARVTVGDDHVILRSGDLILIGPNVPHGATGTSDVAVFLAISPRRA